MSSRVLLLPLIFAAYSAASAAKIELVAGGGTQEPPCAAKEVALREPFGVEFNPSGDMSSKWKRVSVSSVST